MNIPYVKQYNFYGELTNPIVSGYYNYYPNRRQRRSKVVSRNKSEEVFEEVQNYEDVVKRKSFLFQVWEMLIRLIKTITTK